MFNSIWKAVRGWFAPTTATRQYGDPSYDGPWDGAPMWCLVGNIVEERPFGETHEIRRGTKHFTPGTKVYCVPAKWGDGYENIPVVGIARKSRRLITIVMQSKRITNWRAQMVYKPAVLRRLCAAGSKWQSQKETEQYVKFLKERE